MGLGLRIAEGCSTSVSFANRLVLAPTTVKRCCCCAAEDLGVGQVDLDLASAYVEAVTSEEGLDSSLKTPRNQVLVVAT